MRTILRSRNIDALNCLAVASKVPANLAGYEKTTEAIEQSLKATGLGKHVTCLKMSKMMRAAMIGYLDLYLIHSPPSGTSLRVETWRALVDAKKAGKLRDIGVSN